MNRRLLLMIAALAAFALWAGAPGARADRLGGNYRGPEDIYVVHQDSSTAPDSSGATGGGGAPASGGTTAGGGGDSGTGAGGGTGSGSGGSGGGSGGSGGGSGGSGGGSGGSGGGSGGSGGGSGGSGGGSGSGSPDAGGASGGSGGGSTSGGTTTSGGTGSSSGSGSGSGGPSGSSAAGKGKSASKDDKDKIWPFYFEGAKEEYLAAVLSRRPDLRLAPSRSSTGVISPLPGSGHERRAIGETDRQDARDLVMGRLQDPDSHVRDAAVIALGKSGYKELIQSIQKAAESDLDPAVREDALLALGLSGQNDAALPYLLKALASPATNKNEHRVAYAALGLGLLGNRDGAAEPLRKLFQANMARTGGEEEAICAAAALGMLGDPAALPVFEKALGTRAVPESVVCYTIHAVGEFGASPEDKVRKEALNILFAALQQKELTVRQSALLALGGFNETLAISTLVGKDGLGNSDTYAKAFAAHSLGRIAGRMAPASKEYQAVAKELVDIAKNDKKDRWLFQAGSLALASMSYADQEKQFLTLIADAAKLNDHSASAVVLGLGMLGTESPAVAQELQKLFTSRATNLGAYSGLALAMTGSPTAADSLAKMFADETRPNSDVARVAALAIGLVGGAKDADLLVEILKGTVGGQQADTAKFFLKGAAVQGLGLIGDGDTVKKLKPLLESRDWDQRAFATAALGYILEPTQEHRVSPRISGIFRHHNYHVSVAIVRAVQSTL